jgi:hypothetical protein
MNMLRTQSCGAAHSAWHAPKRRLACAIALAVAALATSFGSMAAPLAVPNGDFSAAGNEGSVGGGLIGASGNGVAIGSGPWSGSYAGVLGFLAPPTLTIADGRGTISGLSVVALGINNRAAFTQTLAAPYAATKHYVLAADITAGNTLLGVELLSSGNAGLALTQGGSTLASTQGGNPIALTFSGNDTYHAAIGFDSAEDAAGAIGVQLYSNPGGVLAANLLGQIAFDSVALTQASIPALPPNGLFPADGTPQVTTVNTAFTKPFTVQVVDAEGDPLEGIDVTFTVPDSGPSANLTATTVQTDVGGRAQVGGTANGSAGHYTITVAVDGIEPPALFELENSPAGQAEVGGFHANGHQATGVGQPFSCMLAVQVIADAEPAEGATVVFNAPASGASATLHDAANNSGSMLTETTNANGVAMVSAIANGNAGAYGITATATALSSGALTPAVELATFPMTNLSGEDSLFGNGFDFVPAACGSF